MFSQRPLQPPCRLDRLPRRRPRRRAAGPGAATQAPSTAAAAGSACPGTRARPAARLSATRGHQSPSPRAATSAAGAGCPGWRRGCAPGAGLRPGCAPGAGCRCGPGSSADSSAGAAAARRQRPRACRPAGLAARLEQAVVVLLRLRLVHGLTWLLLMVVVVMAVVAVVAVVVLLLPAEADAGLDARLGLCHAPADVVAVALGRAGQRLGRREKRLQRLCGRRPLSCGGREAAAEGGRRGGGRGRGRGGGRGRGHCGQEGCGGRQGGCAQRCGRRCWRRCWRWRWRWRLCAGCAAAESGRGGCAWERAFTRACAPLSLAHGAPRRPSTGGRGRRGAGYGSLSAGGRWQGPGGGRGEGEGAAGGTTRKLAFFVLLLHCPPFPPVLLPLALWPKVFLQ